MNSLTRRGALKTGAALASAVALAPLAGCGGPTADKGGGADDAFKAIGDKWLADTAKYSPVYATFLGDHRFDAELDDVSAAGRTTRATVTKEAADALAKIDRAKLSRDNQVDAAMLAEQLELDAFMADKVQEWAWDPLTYSDTAGNALYSLMAREFAPLNDRLLAAASRMEKLPGMLAETRKQLDPARVPPIHAQTLLRQSGGGRAHMQGLVVRPL